MSTPKKSAPKGPAVAQAPAGGLTAWEADFARMAADFSDPHQEWRRLFSEFFGTFLLGSPKIREPFLRYHGDLLEPGYWQRQQQRIREGVLEDVFPYPEALRFRHTQGEMS